MPLLKKRHFGPRSSSFASGEGIDQCWFTPLEFPSCRVRYSPFTQQVATSLCVEVLVVGIAKAHSTRRAPQGYGAMQELVECGLALRC